MSVVEANDTNFDQLLADHDKVVVKYYADWCGSCRLFKPKFKRLSGDERFGDVAFLDVNAEHSPQARKAANVSNLPSMAIFKNGELVETIATSKEEVVVNMIDKLKS